MCTTRSLESKNGIQVLSFQNSSLLQKVSLTVDASGIVWNDGHKIIWKHLKPASFPFSLKNNKYAGSLSFRYHSLQSVPQKADARLHISSGSLLQTVTREAVTAMSESSDLSTRTGKRDIVFLTVLYATAGRIDEIRSIKISHLHLDAQKPYVNIYGKGEKTRTAYLLQRAVAHIRVYLKEFHGENPEIKCLSDVMFPDAEKIILVMDNLNTHKPASLYKVFAPAEARRIIKRLEIHYTPKHGSWLNMAEIELNVMTRQCLSRRIETIELLRNELSAWESERNQSSAKIKWHFQTGDASEKLISLYPIIY